MQIKLLCAIAATFFVNSNAFEFYSCVEADTKMSNAELFDEIANGKFPDGVIDSEQLVYEHPLVKRYAGKNLIYF